MRAASSFAVVLSVSVSFAVAASEHPKAKKVAPDPKEARSSTLTISLSDLLLMDLWKACRENAWCFHDRADPVESFRAADTFQSFVDLATCWLLVERREAVHVRMQSKWLADGTWRIEDFSEARFKGGAGTLTLKPPFGNKAYKFQVKVFPRTIRNALKEPTATLTVNYAITVAPSGVDVRTEWFLPDCYFQAVGVGDQHLRPHPQRERKRLGVMPH
jgi:hypothetical protein